MFFPHTKRKNFSNSSGFTIFELLMVMAVMGIAVTLFVVNIDKTLNSMASQSVKEVLMSSIRDARLTSVTGKRPVILRYESGIGAFVLFDHYGQVFARYSLDEQDVENIESIDLWPISSVLRSQSARSYGGFEIAEDRIEDMRFEPTGVSSFIAFEIVYDANISDSEWILIDPFSNGELEGGLD